VKLGPYNPILILCFPSLTPRITELRRDNNPNMVSIETLISRIRAELCDDLVVEQVSAWGPAEKSGGNGFVHSWTDTISKDIGTVRHYITCSGDCNGLQCLECWNRRAREHLPPGPYCVFGSHVKFDGTVVSEIKPPSALKGRSLKRLRQLWAEHVLNSSNDVGDIHQKANLQSEDSLLSQHEIEKMRLFLQNAISKSAESNKAAGFEHKQKILGQGAGGWAGLTEAGIVLKRDSGASILGNYEDDCYNEPGGCFRSGDLEAWSSMAIRDGRWRPGYHLEVLFC
jgi:hypothetical protein